MELKEEGRRWALLASHQSESLSLPPRSGLHLFTSPELPRAASGLLGLPGVVAQRPVTTWN